MNCVKEVNQKITLLTDTAPMEPKEPFDFEAFKREAIKGLYAGQPINGDVSVQKIRYSFPVSETLRGILFFLPYLTRRTGG